MVVITNELYQMIISFCCTTTSISQQPNMSQQLSRHLDAQRLRADRIPWDHHPQLPHEAAGEAQAAALGAQGLACWWRELLVTKQIVNQRNKHSLKVSSCFIYSCQPTCWIWNSLKIGRTCCLVVFPNPKRSALANSSVRSSKFCTRRSPPQRDKESVRKVSQI